ncbi:efflux transporter outer membrane subunit [Dyadobacter chenwenxiniae]|uniref:Efflux transporter outer membrane subunit n=1 Tax=Dyadobacter chenwenxiniae TaxID=2906456 RepID=A0A9X1PIB0_9BACT|nr:efflux transporter outer membrane subunit [Dyadobacter chenwenxiniae]MCF0060464.1 efflux transporter outer membrane subunit [Dyadobacter chenwenxiniae]UON86196.1 efflux transporter outer membrane subunit [Dyadobacter chenwenxiniae]
MKKIGRGPCFALLLMAMLASCRVTKPYRQPETAVEGLYRGVKAADTTNIAHLSWREMFTDTVLQGLISKGINNNLDLKIAVTRIQSAEANLRQSKLALWPSLSVSPSFTLSKTSSAQLRSFNIQGDDSGGGGATTVIPTVKQYALTASTSWEADVWGKLRSTKRAYLAYFLQSEAYKRSVQTQLVADIATNYFALLAYDQQLRITQETIEIRRSDVQTMKELKQAARVTGADVVQSESNLYAAEVSLPDIRQNIRETENALSVLLAIPPDSIPRTRLDEQLRDGSLQTGIPAQLLANRPDVQQAEYSFRNAFELTNVARTYFYPSLSITGTGGFATANTLSNFFTGTFYGNLVAGLTQPIFSQGEIKRRLRTAEATQAEAYFTYQSTLLTAGQEVSNALYSHQMAVEKSMKRQQQLEALAKAVSYTKEFVRYTSNTNFTDVLTSEQNLLAAQLNGVDDTLQRLRSIVQLYRALGGGWR